MSTSMPMTSQDRLPTPHDTHNRVALVTGAGSGIGRATALALLADGWQVVLSGRRVALLEDSIALAGSDAGRAVAIAADVTDAGSVAALFAAIESRFGRLDLLFNNAGVSAPAVPIDELPLEHWHAVVDTNLTGVFLCLQQAFGLMKRQSPRGGRIINNGSISATTPRPLSIAYTATKHAVSGLTKTAALDGRAFDIAVGQIDIGNAATDMTERMAGGVLQAAGSTRVEARMDVRHAAEAVVHMASLPLSANVLFMNVMATTMPFVGRG